MPLSPPDLGSLSVFDLRAHLLAGSGLPGPRANLSLVDRCAAEVDLTTLRRLSGETDEYLATCGTAGVGRAMAGTEVGTETFAALLGVLTERARDDRWRVREGVARGLQLAADVIAPASAVWGPASPVASAISTWTLSEDPRLVRAALATICEPRLLHAPEAAAAALASCGRATTLFASADAATRRTDAWVSLRKTLEYAWSVAVAADSAAGLPVFRRLLDDPSPVVRSLASKNRTRSRLAKIVDRAPDPPAPQATAAPQAAAPAGRAPSGR
ncbi:hypothetical protein SAMN05216410_2879 [Sanguibacter gelidistatuariae]|uniref:HEAT repeat-containing protein n=1 Tax=Sanguibacter gelidistatuariae TaxID=1814289 RepID=A0A1G6S6U0_9MICO|nr:hypothetical protein [Sanguibacter gelidistatuariae]SDD11906.1 hypothetical protein SAMN05216410_2879 [Sanguibacter gelidistatuariae]